MTTRAAADLVVCVATPLEADGLPLTVAGRTLTILETGVGPVNAAFALTRFLSAHDARLVVSCGVGGAYPGSHLEPGDVACAQSELYGDLGAESTSGFLDMEALGFPVIPGPVPLFNRLPLDLVSHGAPRAVRDVRDVHRNGRQGHRDCRADRRRGRIHGRRGDRPRRTADGRAGRRVRGISNAVGTRARETWRLHEAAANARQALVSWIEGGAC